MSCVQRAKHAEEYSKLLSAKTSIEAEYERKLAVISQENSRLREELISVKEQARRVGELEEMIERQRIVLANAEESLLLKVHSHSDEICFNYEFFKQNQFSLFIRIPKSLGLKQR